MPAYGRRKPRRTMRREDYLTGAQAHVDSSIQAVATELLIRQDAARLLPLIHRQCLRSHRNRPSNSELSEAKPFGAQEKTRTVASHRESIICNPLVAGSSPARPTQSPFWAAILIGHRFVTAQTAAPNISQNVTPTM